MAGSLKPRPYGPSTRRHPAEITADRLRDHYEKWFDKMRGNEALAFSDVITVLNEIAEGER